MIYQQRWWCSVAIPNCQRMIWKMLTSYGSQKKIWKVLVSSFTPTKSWLKTWLVVDLPLWKIWKSVGMILPNIYGKIKAMFQTTNQGILNRLWTTICSCHFRTPVDPSLWVCWGPHQSQLTNAEVSDHVTEVHLGNDIIGYLWIIPGSSISTFFLRAVFAYARSDILCSLKERMRTYVLTDGNLRFFPGYLRYFPGRYAYSFGFKMHEVQKWSCSITLIWRKKRLKQKSLKWAFMCAFSTIIYMYIYIHNYTHV